MGRGRPEKYNRITCQQKFILRRLIIKERMSVKQVHSSYSGSIDSWNQLFNCKNHHVFPPKIQKF